MSAENNAHPRSGKIMLVGIDKNQILEKRLQAAGCHVVAVPSVAPIAPAARRTVVTSLEEVDLPFLRGLMATTIN